MADSHREHPGESWTGIMAAITMRNEEEIENELLGDTSSNPTARYQTVSIPTKDWNFTKAQNEIILLEFAAMTKKKGTAAQQANTPGNSRPAEKMYKRTFESDSDNEADCESISNGSAIQTQKRQRKSDSDKEPADAAHITNQSKSSQQDNDDNELSDFDPKRSDQKIVYFAFVGHCSESSDST